jgi:hypothetical protein
MMMGGVDTEARYRAASELLPVCLSFTMRFKNQTKSLKKS